MVHTHRVLIVEDDYAFRWSLAIRCQQRDIDADVAETLAEARELITRDPNYCGVMLDLKMGASDGITLLDTIAGRENPPNVVVVTAYPDVWERVASTDSGRVALVSETLVKPVEVDAVIAKTLQRCA